MSDIQPLITIGITTFNAIDTIERALHSAQKQSWGNKEIVIVDDCSTDGTWELLESMKLKNTAIRIFQNSHNSGVATSRNRIIDEAHGKFVAFFDDDDESLEDRLHVQYQRIVNYEQRYKVSSPVMCHTARRLVYPHGEERIEQTMGINQENPAPSGQQVVKRILLGEPLDDGYGSCPTCSQMARRSTYLNIGKFDTQFRRSEDTEFNIRVAKAGGHFVGIAKPLVVQFMTKTSEKSLDDELNCMLLVLKKHKDIFLKEKHYKFGCELLKAKTSWLENRKYRFLRIMIKLFVCHPVLLLRRIKSAFPNIGINRAFSRFHQKN